MQEYLNGLNEEQKKAVLDTEGYVLVFAGAGSGKTRVLTNRIAHLVNGKGVNPENVLAITFTNKAADEMKSRLSTMVPGVERMWVSTIHSMCVRILRNSIGRLEGYNTNFSIYSEIDKTNVLKRIITDMNLGDEKEREKYLKNAKLPSVRELALTYAINPNTVQKSLQLLENDGLIVTDRTNGKFVSENADEINLQKNKTIQQEIENFFERMKSFGLDNKEIKELINKIGE